MYHYFYQITNNLNGKVYLGIHSTNNLDDGYMGSGTGIRRAIKKYGIENFTKKIIKFFNTREELSNYEKLVVNESVISSEKYYNQITGGEKHAILGAKLSEEAKHKIGDSKRGKKRSVEANRKNSEARKNEIWVHKSNTEKKRIKRWELQEYEKSGWTRGMGHCRSEEFKDNIRQRRLGIPLSEKHKKAIADANRGRHFSEDHRGKIAKSRVGKVWINNGTVSTAVDKAVLSKYLDSGWVCGMLRRNV